jgi:hypothetical protein
LYAKLWEDHIYNSEKNYKTPDTKLENYEAQLEKIETLINSMEKDLNIWKDRETVFINDRT